MEVFEYKIQPCAEKCSWSVLNPSSLVPDQKIVFHDVFAKYSAPSDDHFNDMLFILFKIAKNGPEPIEIVAVKIIITSFQSPL